ncbi:hypothetical protein GCM10010300_40970 [Streptomyces olivaceoviridis]|nr:hypothetical protein GCM10010300_40970 [Streptomyces olivaceoviridis]
MLRGAQAGRSMYLSKAVDGCRRSGVRAEATDRLPMERPQPEIDRPFPVTACGKCPYDPAV